MKKFSSTLRLELSRKFLVKFKKNYNRLAEEKEKAAAENILSEIDQESE